MSNHSVSYGFSFSFHIVLRCNLCIHVQSDCLMPLKKKCSIIDLFNSKEKEWKIAISAYIYYLYFPFISILFIKKNIIPLLSFNSPS